MKSSKAQIAFFDFDGTLTSKDSLADFIQFAVGKRMYWLGLMVLAPILIGYKIRLIRNDVAKQQLISYFFKGWDYDRFQKLADYYSTDRIDRITRPDAMEKLSWHLVRNHTVVVVSASMHAWLDIWCERHSLELIATRLEIRSGILTGKFESKNCYGIEKLDRIRQRYDLESYDTIYAYGDSPGDKHMLSIANERFYRHFK